LILLFPLGFILFKFGRVNSWLFVSAIYLLTALPVCIWQLKRGYDAVSPSLEETATIEGCSSWQLFYSLILPAAAPALWLAAFFSFVSACNDYVIAALVLRDTTIFPLPAALRAFSSNSDIRWASYATGVFVLSLALALLLLLLRVFFASTRQKLAKS
jgi:arabinogalactan oligomer / maltooligosaccharide transport system permease protein